MKVGLAGPSVPTKRRVVAVGEEPLEGISGLLRGGSDVASGVPQLEIERPDLPVGDVLLVPSTARVIAPKVQSQPERQLLERTCRGQQLLLPGLGVLGDWPRRLLL